MRFFATLAIATAININASTEKMPTAKEVFKMCNTNGDKVLDYQEVDACFQKNNVTE